LLLSRWTKSTRNFLPPIDWDAPQTFSAFDRQAWELVEAEAERGESLDMAALTRFDTYIDTGRRLATRLAAHYHPLATDPIERVPVVELITALELAAEDLAKLSRQVPGGDLITPADYKRAVVAANYIQKASDLYTYLLPLFNPVTGLPRIASQHLMVKPAWKSMQQNVLRWSYRAFVNRLGTHLIELYSGRLSIGADHYRKLTRKAAQAGEDVEMKPAPLVIDVAGARGSGKSRLIEAIGEAREGDPAAIESKVVALGGDMVGWEMLREGRLVEVDGYVTWTPGNESARGRSTRRLAVAQAAESDLLILTIDVRAETWEADDAFLKDWTRWYAEHPGLEIPPVMVVVTHVNSPAFVGEWLPPHDWTNGRGPREEAVRSKIQAIRASLPPTIAEIVAAAPGAGVNSGVVESVLPALTRLCHRAERNALIRNLRAASSRSRAGRLVRQVGRHGRSLWKSLRDRGKTG
jgi:hypothetical protein